MLDKRVCLWYINQASFGGGAGEHLSVEKETRKAVTVEKRKQRLKLEAEER